MCSLYMALGFIGTFAYIYIMQLHIPPIFHLLFFLTTFAPEFPDSSRWVYVFIAYTHAWFYVSMWNLEPTSKRSLKFLSSDVGVISSLCRWYNCLQLSSPQLSPSLCQAWVLLEKICFILSLFAACLFLLSLCCRMLSVLFKNKFSQCYYDNLQFLEA